MSEEEGKDWTCPGLTEAGVHTVRFALGHC